MTTHSVHGSSTRRSRSLRRRGRAWTALVLAGVTPTVGCYATRPLDTAPVPGTTLVLDLNDRARVALGDRIGPGALKIEGEVMSASDTSYVVGVSQVEYLNGQVNKWNGEQIAVSTQFVSRAVTRQFSKSRTIGLSVGIAAAILLAITKVSFLHIGSGTTTVENPPVPGGNS